MTKLGYKLEVLTDPYVEAEAYFYEDGKGKEWIDEVCLHCDYIHLEKIDRNIVYLGVSTKEMALTKFSIEASRRGNIKISMYDDEIGLDKFQSGVYTRYDE